MDIERLAAFAPRTRELAEEMEELQGPCIGCEDCSGICHVLFDLIRLPDLVLKGDRE